jgi:hypothetical protein
MQKTIQLFFIVDIHTNILELNAPYTFPYSILNSQLFKWKEISAEERKRKQILYYK